jgi:hypothetical protein
VPVFAGKPVFARGEESAIARVLELRYRYPLNVQITLLLFG